MSEDEMRNLKNPEDDARIYGTDEGEADVEGHVRATKNDEGETEGDDDFEAHKMKVNRPPHVN